MALSQYELERERNIARNKVLLEALELEGAGTETIPPKASRKDKPKPVQSSRGKKRTLSQAEDAPRRQSGRLRAQVVDPNESPAKRRKREQEAESIRRQEERDRLEQEERNRVARLPRHQNLDLEALGTGEQTPEETAELLSSLAQLSYQKDFFEPGAMSEAYFEERLVDSALEELRVELQDLTVVSRAKVTQDRIYSAVYHGDKTKDLIFFGDKHGQLGIWDARAQKDDQDDDDEDVATADDREAGKIWRLQPHWPATSKSSISCCKLDPLSAQTIFTASYDCSIRKLSFETGTSEEVFAFEDCMPTSFDFVGVSHEIWVSDHSGMINHIDIREAKKLRRYQLSGAKIGCVSVNPAFSYTLLCASNDRTLKLWDARKIEQAPLSNLSSTAQAGSREISVSSLEGEQMENYLETDQGKDIMRGEWSHGKSVSSAYWSPFGNQIVSTSYDDHLRLWTKKHSELSRSGSVHSMRPFKNISHNCQTGKWLTILRAQWSPNPYVYPHFTIGNMDHSLDIYSGQGELLTKLSDPSKITAVQAVTCSSPTVVGRVASGNASGRCVLWAPKADE